MFFLKVCKETWKSQYQVIYHLTPLHTFHRFTLACLTHFLGSGIEQSKMEATKPEVTTVRHLPIGTFGMESSKS